ncbi:uncharacterized protein LOC103367902 [Stegastes partitus]|nr:PREDICTED: uncharacterized protein LOC103367902 [Stegastes partitus]
MALPFVSIPDASWQEQDTPSYTVWSCNAQDDLYKLTSCSQSGIKSRKPDIAGCDGETDLQDLVSNILDEADSQDSYLCQGSIPNPIWSPKTLTEELLQYFQSDASTQHNPSFPPNQLSHETFGKTQQLSVNQDVKELSQQSSGFANNQTWLFNLPNGDSYCRPAQKLPSVAPMPNAGSTYPSQTQPVSMSAYNDRGIGQPMNNFLNLSDIFRPQSATSSSCFDPFHEDNLIQNSVKSIYSEQYVPEDINQLVSSFQSVMADSVYHGDFPNTHKLALGMHHEDSMAEEWEITSPAMSTQSTPAMQIPKQLVGEFGTRQRERTEGVRKQTFKCDAFQDRCDFTPQNTECFQQSKPFSAPLNIPNQYQNKMTVHRENINVSMNQYSNHHIQLSQIQNKIKPQIQKEKKRMHMSGVLGEDFSRRPQTNAHMREGDKQHLSQSPHFDFQSSQQSQSSIFSGGNVQQVMPFMYPGNDLRRQPSMSINSNFSSRSTLPYGSGVPGANVGDMISANDSQAFNSYVGDIRTHRAESTCHVPASAMTTSVLMNQGGPVIQPCFYLCECYEQWRFLEKERKKIEATLKTVFRKGPAGVTNMNLPKTPPYPTTIDHLIVNQTRQYTKVESLLERMECLCSTPLCSNIHAALKRHHMAICITQARCMDTANMTKHQRQKPHFTEDRGPLLLSISVKDLAASTRKLRTALWCALQMTLPKAGKMQYHVNKEDTCSV